MAVFHKKFEKYISQLVIAEGPDVLDPALIAYLHETTRGLLAHIGHIGYY